MLRRSQNAPSPIGRRDLVGATLFATIDDFVQRKRVEREVDLRGVHAVCVYLQTL